MTARAGVAGFPIAHSLSPAIHGAWIAAAGLDAVYEAFGPEDEAGFARLADRVRAGSLRGLNVTAPFKARALAEADAASETARRCGSANLLTVRAGRLVADSTDGIGLMAALAEQAPGLDVRDRAVVILGAGGAARAAAAALVKAGARVSLINRTPESARALAEDLGHGVAVAGPEALEAAALVVNALSVPPGIDPARLAPGAVVMDMTYRPLETPFLAAARGRGLIGVDGLAMLIGQARPSFEAMFGVPVPGIDVRSLILSALSEGAS